MSYILDALRKSEQERRPSGNLRIGRRDPGPVALPGRGVAFYAAPTVLVVALLAAAAYVWVRPSQQPSPTDTIDAPITTASAPAAPPPPAMREAAIAPPAPIPVRTASPVRDLVEQTRVAPPPPPPRAHTNPPVQAAVLAHAAPASASPTNAARRVGDDVRLLRVMPPDFQKSLPEMVVNIHVYAANEAERILYINNRQYQAGDKVRDDVMVEEIVEDGAVLNFRGQRFKLPRPS